MNSSGIFINMPVMKAESARDDDERSRKDQKKQLERQLPRMRIADEKKSEKILADAMRTGSRKNLEQRTSELPQPATARSLQRRADLEQSLNERVIDMRQSPNKQAIDMGQLPNERAISEATSFDAHEMKAGEKTLTSEDLHDLEERLQCRKNPPSASEILSIIKKLEIKAQNQNKTEREAMKNETQQADLLCSLDFIDGYVGTMANPREIRAAITEVMESLRGEIMMLHSKPVSAIEWQQENILQLIGNTDAKCTLRHDAAGHTQVIIEANEEASQEKSSLGRAPEPIKNQPNRKPAAGDDTLPLVVQRSV
jgi:hypothetical protein